jgi:hypothetical protein
MSSAAQGTDPGQSSQVLLPCRPLEYRVHHAHVGNRLIRVDGPYFGANRVLDPQRIAVSA